MEPHLKLTRDNVYLFRTINGRGRPYTVEINLSHYSADGTQIKFFEKISSDTPDKAHWLSVDKFWKKYTLIDTMPLGV